MSLISDEQLDGKHAFRTGLGLDDNPHNIGEREYTAWRRGWEMESSYANAVSLTTMNPLMAHLNSMIGA